MFILLGSSFRFKPTVIIYSVTYQIAFGPQGKGDVLYLFTLLEEFSLCWVLVAVCSLLMW